MEKSKLTDSQIIIILKQSEAQLCREHGMRSVTFYRWRANYGGLDASLMSRIKAPEDENRHIKTMYTEERIKVQIVHEALTKKVVKPSRRTEMAQQFKLTYNPAQF